MDDSFTEQSSTKKSSAGKRRSNRNEKTQSSNLLRLENNLVNEEKRFDLKKNGDSLLLQTENLIDKTDNTNESLSYAKIVRKENKDILTDEPLSVNAIDSALPRKRAAALAAAVSVSETVNPQRSVSPRKRIATTGKIIYN